MTDDDNDGYVYSYRDCPCPEDLFARPASQKDREMRAAIFGESEESFAQTAYEERPEVITRRIPENLRDPANPFRFKHPVFVDLPNWRTRPSIGADSTRPPSLSPAFPPVMDAPDQAPQRSSTFCLSLNDLQNAYNALLAANCLKRPFNCYIDLGWHLLGFVNEDAADREFQKFTKALRQWLRRGAKLTEPVFLFVFERSNERGVHCHGMLHIPLAYADAFKSWFVERGKEIGRTRYSPKVWHIRVRRDFHSEHQLIRFNYMMKGVDQEAYVGPLNPSWGELQTGLSKTLSLRKGYRDTGELHLKRLRFSRILSPAFLSQNRFRSLLDVKAGKMLEQFHELDGGWFEDRSVERAMKELEEIQL